MGAVIFHICSTRTPTYPAVRSLRLCSKTHCSGSIRHAADVPALSNMRLVDALDGRSKQFVRSGAALRLRERELRKLFAEPLDPSHGYMFFEMGCSNMSVPGQSSNVHIQTRVLCASDFA